MSHELSIQNGKVEMAYVGAKPWHGLGQKMAEGASIEEWLVAAGMDWRIQRSKVRFATERGATEFATMDDKDVLLRSDTKAPLSIVSDKFKVVQPKATLEFFRDLTESAGMALETAGCLFDGRRFWALASTGESSFITDPRDRVKGYLLLSTSCDGSMATEARYTTICVVCNNTLSAARGDGKAKVRVTHRSVFNADAAKQELGIERSRERFAETMDSFRQLAAAPITPQQVLAQTAELFAPKLMEQVEAEQPNGDFQRLLTSESELGKEFQKLLEAKPFKRVFDLAVNGGQLGGDLDSRKGTQWGWVNGVTQFVDHEGTARSQDNRLASAWFGTGNDLKERAFEMALTAAK